MSEAFGFDVPPQSPPPLPHQPSPYHGTIGNVATIGFATLGLLILLLILFSGRGPLLTERMTLPQTGQVQSATFGPITLDGAYQAVSIKARDPAPDTAWVDLDYALVDRRTQVSYPAFGVADSYSARGSPWSTTAT